MIDKKNDHQALVRDRAFITAVERAYLRELSYLELDASLSDVAIHSELLARSIYKADPTNGGLRFKRLARSDELEARLLRALSQRMNPEEATN